MTDRSPLVLKLREMVLSGKFEPGERLAEVRVAELLGVSRTPVRSALASLAREGLVDPAPGHRGFVVRATTLKDTIDATELRGVLEGAAARQVAEAGAPEFLIRELEDAVAATAKIFQRERLDEEAGATWADQNARFHEAIVQASANGPLIHLMNINNQVPFSSAAAFLDDHDDEDATRRQLGILAAAQRHHETIIACLKRGEGARVEALMREHCHLAIENITLFKGGLDVAVRRTLAL